MKKMKHLLLNILLTITVIMLMNVCVFADFSGREADVLWEIDTSDGTLTISGIGNIKDYEFGEAPWYKYSSSVKSVVVESGISNISYGALYGMEYVESLTVPFVGDGSSNRFIGYAFGAKDYYENNTYLPEMLRIVTVTSESSLEAYAFNNCYNIKEIILSDSVKSIGNNAFNNCTSLESVVFGSEINYIGSRVFDNCSSFKNVLFNGTFSQWDGLSSKPTSGFSVVCLKDETFTVTAPAKTVYKLGEKFSASGIKATFGSRDVTADVVITPAQLTAIGTDTYTVRYGSLIHTGNVTVDANDTSGVAGGISWNFDNTTGRLTLSGNGTTDNYTLEILPPWYQYRNNITTIVVESGIESLGDYVFYAHNAVKTITTSESVESIGYAAFEGCNSLTSLTIGNAGAVVDATAFRGCDGLVYSNGTSEYYKVEGNNYYMLKKAVSLSSFNAGTAVIGENAFEGASITNTNVIIPDSIISIGNGAFRDCVNIETVQFGKNVKLIGNSAFDGCTSLTTVKFSDTPKSVGVLAFAGCPLNTKEENNALYIGSDENPHMILISATNTDITSCEINSNTKVISALAFANCKSLATVVLPEGLEVIGNSAFNGCSALYSIDIPYGTEYIGSLAFKDCTELRNVSIGSSVEYIGNGAFRDATSLEKIVLPFSLKNLGYNAFRGCTSLTTVAISKGVKALGYKAFEGCTSLVDVYIPDSLYTIGDYSFKGCTKLQNIAIPHTVVSIGFGAFASCEKLEDIVLPFAGERADGNYPFVGYIFGATSANSNEIAVPDSIKTVLVGGDICANAFIGVEIDTLIIDKTVSSIAANSFDTVNNVYYIGTESEWSEVSCNEQFTPVEFLNNSLTVLSADNVYQVGDMVDFADLTAQSGSLNVISLIRLSSNPLVESGEDINVSVYLGSLKSDFKANIKDRVKITGYSLTLEGSIGIKVYVKLSPFAILNIDDIKATVTLKNTPHTVTLVNAGDKNDSTLYYTKFGVAAKEMNEGLTFAFETAGVVDTATVSVKDYVDYVNDNSAFFADVIDLINAMYTYGEYSRAYFTGAEDIEPKLDLSDTTISIPSNYSAVKVGTVSGVSIYGASLFLESNTTVRYYFKLEEGASIDDYTFLVDGRIPLTPKLKGNYYYVDVQNIFAHKLGEMRVITVTDGNDTSKFVYGPFSYAKRLIENNLSSERDLALVVKALYNYYVESREYYKFLNVAPIIPEDNESGYQIW